MLDQFYKLAFWKKMEVPSAFAYFLIVLLCFCGGSHISKKYNGFVQSAIIRNNAESAMGDIYNNCPAVITSLRDNLSGKCIQKTLLKDCCDVFLLGRKSGVYWLDRSESTRIMCDMETSGGGWLVFGRRNKNKSKFEKKWNKYVKGFGILNKEFWLGLDALHYITSNTTTQLRFDIDGGKKWAQYDYFSVGGPETNYTLTVGNYSGGNLPDAFSLHNGAQFSTVDRDNDWAIIFHCSLAIKTGWWYTACYRVGPFSEHVDWVNVTRSDQKTNHYSSIEMKIRSKRFPCSF